MPKVGSNCTSLAVILIDFVLRKWKLLLKSVFIDIEKEKKWLNILMMTNKFFLMILRKNRLKVNITMHFLRKQLW